MNIKSFALPTLTLLIGIFIGWILPGGKSAKAPALAKNLPSVHESAKGKAARKTAVGRSDRRPPGEVVVPSEKSPASEPEMIRVPASLIESLSIAAGVRKMNQELFLPSDRIAEALRITDPEKAAIQTGWRDIRQKINQLETASMESEHIDEWTERITVADLSKSMVSLGNGFRTKVHETLGDDRSEAFLAAKQVDRMFSPPPGEKIYTVTSEAVGDGNWRYHFKMEGPEGQRVWVGGNVPDELRHLTDATRISPSLKP